MIASEAARNKRWYALSTDETIGAVHGGHNGLTGFEARERLARNGPNALPEAKQPLSIAVFFRQFNSSLIYLLLGASVIVFAFGEVTDGGIILAVLIFNAIVGTIQEGKAHHTLRSLQHYTQSFTTALRDKAEVILPDTQLVVGDIVILQEGEKVPADARLISVNRLFADEASLTGESTPVQKTSDVLRITTPPLADQKNMVWKGTNIVRGHGSAVVVATGIATVIGRIATSIKTIETDIPLKKDMRALSRLIMAAVAAVCTSLITLGLITGNALSTMLLTSVAVAVSIIPEGLPIVLTLILATGVWRMSQRHALVKNLQAVESLGQTRVLAVDKTGTLTKNELVVERVLLADRVYTVSGTGYEPKGTITIDGKAISLHQHPLLERAAQIAAWNATARVSYLPQELRWKVTGDPTEAAMRVFAEKLGWTETRIGQLGELVFELPFTFQEKVHVTIHNLQGNRILAVSGAPETVLALCTTVSQRQGTLPLSEHKRRVLNGSYLELAADGFRLVALAWQQDAAPEYTPTAPLPLSFLGFLAMRDAPRPGVPTAVARVRAAGIRVIMLSGDHRLTTKSVARAAGIASADDAVVEGVDIDRMPDDQLVDAVGRAAVYARVTPEHKLRIIKAFRQRGDIVAMTGDGVNDAPSLVAADLGVAMGRIGTDVAKEASDIVLLDDDFSTMVAAVKEGRSIFLTIKKVVLYLFSTSFGEALTIIGALALGWPLPILPAQIIWLNFVTDGFLDVALAMEPREHGLLRGTFERPKRYFVDASMSQRIVLMGLVMMVGTLLLVALSGADSARMRTIALTGLAAFQWMNAWNCRSQQGSIFARHQRHNPFLIIATIVIIILHLFAVYAPPLQRILHTTALRLTDWIPIIAVASSIIFVEELRKWLERKRSAKNKPAALTV